MKLCVNTKWEAHVNFDTDKVHTQFADGDHGKDCMYIANTLNIFHLPCC
jgi:hypothetical protein